MELLLTLLLISHIAVLYLLRKDIKEYKRNNQIFIHRELQTIHNSFDIGVHEIAKTIERMRQSSDNSLRLMENSNLQFEQQHKEKFNELIIFIKKDYTSLTSLLSHNNQLLSNLIKETEKNITQNEQLKPLLINTHEELQKVYGKIRQVITSSEKNMKDAKEEIANAMIDIQSQAESKLKQLAAQGEKSLNDSVRENMEVINDVASATNLAIKTLHSDNHLNKITTQVDSLEKNFNQALIDWRSKNNEILDRIEILVQKVEEEGTKKNKWDFLKK